MVSSYHASSSPVFDGNRWAISFISLLWKFTRKLWNYRNQIVHGMTVDEVVSTQMSLLHEKVTCFYNQYTKNPSYVLPHHEYLFTQCTLEYHLQMSYDSITCWLQSVEEARHILEFQQRHLQEIAAMVFRLFRSPSFTSIRNSDSDSSYDPSMTLSTMSRSAARTHSTDSLTDWTSASSSDDSIYDSDSSCSMTSSVVVLNHVINNESPSIQRERSPSSPPIPISPGVD